MNNDLNVSFANAIRAYRRGRIKPVTMSSAASGRLFHDLAQELIQQQLSDKDYQHYCCARDLSRRAVKAIHTGDYIVASQGFQQVDEYLLKYNVTDEVEHLSRSWQHQGAAYLEIRKKNLQQARKQLSMAMSCDYALEKNYQYELFHVARIHVLHLMLRIEAEAGKFNYAIDLAQHIYGYLLGEQAELPLGEGWSDTLAKSIPETLRNALLARISSEVGTILATQPLASQRLLFTRFTGWTALQKHPLLSEIYRWGLAKQAFVQGDTLRFLDYSVAVLTPGRQETTLWYSTALDLLRSCQSLRAKQTQSFQDEVGEDAKKWHTLAAEFFPKSLTQHFTALYPLNNYQHRPPQRQFQVYSVGLPRTGTTSMYTLFKKYRSSNEFMEQETICRIIARQGGTLSEKAFAKYLLRRDQEGALEMDSASFNHFYLDLLAETYPHAKFIFMIREPYSWMNSYLKMLMRWRQSFELQNKEIPQWMSDYGQILFANFSWSMISSAETVKLHADILAGAFLQHWEDANQRILDLLPADRSLIIRTHELSSQRHLIADFLQISPKNLTEEHHANASSDKTDLFHGLPPAILNNHLTARGTQILEQFFHTV